jgi:hypothetical protein
MDEHTNAARAARPTLPLIVSTRLYRALLAVYPSEFRRAYGGPMLQAFRDGCRRALREAGAAGLLSLWGRTLLDTVQTALEEHAQRGVDMSREKFIKLSGWALMLGGLAVMLGWLAGTRPDYNRFDARSLPIDRYANAAEFPLIVMGLLLLSAGFIGLYLRYGQSSGGFGRLSLGLGALSGAASALGAIGLGLFDSDPWWSLFFFGMVFQYLGLALFGLANLRRKALPRWNGLPLLAGVWVPAFTLASLIIEQARGGWVELPEAVFMSLWLLSLAGLAGLGYLLQSDSRPAGATAQAI